MQRKKKIISILNMAHSGSTVFSAFLARHPDIVTLGEVRGSLSKVKKGGVERSQKLGVHAEHKSLHVLYGVTI